MRAMVWTAYGGPDAFELQERPEPEPKPNEIKIKVAATTVTAGDCEARRMDFPLYLRWAMRLYLGVFRPRAGKVQGQELAGEVVAVGEAVTRFAPGDKVYAATLMRFGACAEYLCLPETYPIAPIPPGFAAMQAATIPTGGLNALHFLRMADLKAGDRLLINGAGGSIGTYALQIAKAWGAEVTCVDSAEKLPMLTRLGADVVLDYRQTDFAAEQDRYDVIIDVIGRAVSEHRLSALTPQGRYVLGAPTLSAMMAASRRNKRSAQTIHTRFADYRAEHLTQMHELIAAGKISPAIDKVLPLEALAEAHRYVESGQKQGHVVITL